MDIIYQSIVNRLQSNVPDKLWIDLEAGQLDALDENYPVQFPAVFIDFANCSWENLGQGHQQGLLSVNFRVAFNIYDEFHSGSTSIEDAGQQLKLINRIHAALHTFGGNILPDGNDGYLDTHFSPLTRNAFSSERRSDGLRVFNMSYTTEVYDNHAAKQYTLVPAEPNIVVQ